MIERNDPGGGGFILPFVIIWIAAILYLAFR